jgi:regulator of sigma E protease
MVLIVAHEFGHFIAARKSGVKVDEFGIGFPPKLWSCEWGKKGSGKWFKRNDTDELGTLTSGGLLFSINCLPIGGFCKMQGESDAASKKGDYGSATFGQKTAILFAGIIANFIAASVVFTILAIVGMPRAFDNQFTIPVDSRETYGEVIISGVLDDSPAAQSGLKPDDKLLSLAGNEISRASQVANLTREHKGQTVEITYIDSQTGGQKTIEATLKNGESGNLGIATYQNEFIKSTWSAPIVGIGTTVQFTLETFKGLGNIFVNFFGGVFSQFSSDQTIKNQGKADIEAVGDSFSGPIGIVGILLPNAVNSGPIYVLFIAGVISISLACMNLLPLPALDGGRWFLTALFKIRRKPLTQEIEGKINTIGFMVLMGLMVLMTILDIGKIGKM